MSWLHHGFFEEDAGQEPHNFLVGDDEDQILVKLGPLKAIIRRANQISCKLSNKRHQQWSETGTWPDAGPTETFARAVGGLMSQLRKTDFHHIVSDFFEPASREEEFVCREIACGIFPRDFDFCSDEQIVAKVNKRHKWLESKAWIDIYLRPKNMPVFIEMCRRKFGSRVAAKMRMHFNKRTKERAERSEKNRKKREAKEKKLKKVDGELRRESVLFTAEGGFRVEPSNQ